DQAQLRKELDNHLGRPAHPKVDGLEEDTAKALQLDAPTLEKGSVLYRRHCLHCHGLTGSGQGSTAAWINPHPRDFRRGIFKFLPTAQRRGRERKPLRQALARPLRQGVEGTAMPAFGALSDDRFGYLPDEQIQQLVSYVIHLSLRGQVEFDTVRELIEAEAEGRDKPDIGEFVNDRLSTLADYWVKANDEKSQIQPERADAFAKDETQKIEALVGKHDM